MPHLWIVIGDLGISGLGLQKHVHDFIGIRGKLFTANSQTDQGNAFNRLSPQQSQLLRVGIGNDVLQTRDKPY